MSPVAGPIDADNHYYEPRDFCTRHIEPRYREQAVRVDAGDRIWVGDRPFTFLKDWSFDRYSRPVATSAPDLRPHPETSWSRFSKRRRDVRELT